MEESTATGQATESQSIPRDYIFNDSVTSYDDYRILIDSDEGREYVTLSTEAERLQYTLLHAHEKSKMAAAQWLFYDDEKAGKSYLIHVGTPEAAEVDRLNELIGDSDELDMESEEPQMLFRYFREHAHKVEEIPRELEGKCGMGDNVQGGKD